MIRTTGKLAAGIGVIGLSCSAAALADNPLGVYVGVGVGTSNVGNDSHSLYSYPGSFHDHDAAWKVLAGVKPLPFLGAELEYIDFGNAGGNDGYYQSYYDSNASSHPKATVLYGLGYLPLPLPFIDVYGKLGVARLQTNTGVTDYGCTGGPSACGITAQYHFDQQNTKLAYGAGVQAKFQDFAVRGEYERISSSYGDPATFMASLTWTF